MAREMPGPWRISPARIILLLAIVSSSGASISLAFTSTRAEARTAGQARQELIRANLHPRPLFPSYLPDPLSSDISAVLTHDRHTFAIQYTDCCSSDGTDLAQLVYSRQPLKSMRQELRIAHRNHEPVKRETVAGHHLYRLPSLPWTPWQEYLWQAGPYAYSVAGQCCLGDRVNYATLRTFIRWLAPLGHEWTGQLPGGGISLYVSAAGLDYEISWVNKCREPDSDGDYDSPTNDGDNPNDIDGTSTGPDGFQAGYEAFTSIHANGTFSDQQSYTDYSSSDRITATIAGKIQGDAAQGLLFGSDKTDGCRLTTAWDARRVQ